MRGHISWLLWLPDGDGPMERDERGVACPKCIDAPYGLILSFAKKEKKNSSEIN
jgi:hypothetical protein